LLAQYVPEERHIDVFLIDVEGQDKAILRSLDWARYRPSVVVYEDHALELGNAREDAFIVYMAQRGYRLVAKAGPSVMLQLRPQPQADCAR